MYLWSWLQSQPKKTYRKATQRHSPDRWIRWNETFWRGVLQDWKDQSQESLSADRICHVPYYCEMGKLSLSATTWHSDPKIQGWISGGWSELSYPVMSLPAPWVFHPRWGLGQHHEEDDEDYISYRFQEVFTSLSSSTAAGRRTAHKNFFS